jgi:fluoroacetyl-CoA thioesterase
MKVTLTPGLTHEFSYRVPEDKTVPHVYREAEILRDMPPVFATAFLVGLIEWACMETIRDYLEADEQSLGTAIAVTHTAATPVGFSVKVTTRVESVEGRRVRFSVRAEDDAELIGEGTHERFVIARQRFLDGVAKKRARLGKA